MPRVLLCGTDAGGAANLAALQPALAKRGAEVRVVTRNRFRHLFGDFPPETTIGEPHDLPEFVRRTRPDAIVCGTTRYDSVDRRLIRIGAGQQVRTTVVLDERYDYRMRFLVDGAPVWPDAITLLDDGSIAEAAAEGLPIERCRVTGSPALARLAERARVQRSAPAPRPPSLAGLPAWPVLVFVSETMAADYGSEPGASGPLGPYAGYTEESVRESLLAALDPERPFIFLDKLHPAATVDPPPPHVSHRGRVMHVVVRDEPLWPLLRAAHAAIGMRSVGLLEAVLLGVPALSFQPGALGSERCTAVRLGAVSRIDDAREAARWCARHLEGAPVRLPPSDLAPAAAGADERVVAAALGNG